MKTSHKVGTGAGAILLAASFIMPWEGLWTTAKVDTIGTGHPVTYCYGETTEAGAVHAGQKFTPAECSDLLKASLPKYWDEISSCIHVALPDKVKASLISAAYNAGSAAMCHSPMIARMNAGDVKGGCDAFPAWYVHAGGKVIKGLQNRRKAEEMLCLEGSGEPAPKAPEAEMSVWTKLKLYLHSIKGK